MLSTLPPPPSGLAPGAPWPPSAALSAPRTPLPPVRDDAVRVTLVIDGTIEHVLDWPERMGDIRRHLQQVITRSDTDWYDLAEGGQVLINWRAVRTVQVREG